MSRLTSSLGAFTLLGAILMLSACRDDIAGPRQLDKADPAGAYLAVAPGSVVLEVGQTVQLTAMLKSPQGTPLDGYSEIHWTSSDTKVASVSAKGMIRAVAQGLATITAGCGDYCAYATVTVIPAKDNRPPHNG